MMIINNYSKTLLFDRLQNYYLQEGIKALQSLLKKLFDKKY